jgi:hypothetical protein
MHSDEPPEALAEVVHTARAAVEQEFQISERLDSKARGLVTLAGQWFAVAQAVSAVAYATKTPHDWMLYAVAGLAATGAIALGFTFLFAWRVWRVRDEGAVSPGGLDQMKARALQDPNTMSLLVDHYASLLRDRRKTNKTRAEALTKAQWIWFAAMALPLIQVGFALATRLFA